MFQSWVSALSADLSGSFAPFSFAFFKVVSLGATSVYTVGVSPDGMGAPLQAKASLVLMLRRHIHHETCGYRRIPGQIRPLGDRDTSAKIRARESKGRVLILGRRGMGNRVVGVWESDAHVLYYPPYEHSIGPAVSVMAVMCDGEKPSGHKNNALIQSMAYPGLYGKLHALRRIPDLIELERFREACLVGLYQRAFLRFSLKNVFANDKRPILFRKNFKQVWVPYVRESRRFTSYLGRETVEFSI